MRIAAAPLALALACALGCASPGAARTGGTPSAGGATALTFAWPDGFGARVRFEHREQRSGSPPATARGTHRLATERAGQVLRVSVRDAEAEGDVPDLEVNLRVAEALVQVVGRDGSYLRTERVREAVELLGAEDEEAREVSRRALERIAALDWELTAGAWAGRTPTPGRVEAREYAGSLPLLPGVEARIEVEQTLVGPAPCVAGEAPPQCVELAWRGAPDRSSRAAAVARLRGEAGEGGSGVVLQDLDGSLEARLVAEPGTLVPHRLIVREELRLTVRQPGGDALENVERTEDRYEFAPEMEL